MRISPIQHAQTATTSSSNAKNSSPDQNERNIEVAELLPKRHRKRRASLIKLTDECLAAINEAIRKEWRIRITVIKENILIHVGNGTATPTIFQCTQQNLPGTIDAIYKEPSAQTAYQTVSSLNTKLVVNATEKTFAETREKAQKLAEEDAKKMVKDVVVKKDPMSKYRTGKNSTMFKPTSFVASTTNLKTTGFTPSSTANAQKRISPPISSTSQVASPSVLSKPGNTSITTSSKPPTLNIQNRHELLKRSTRERCLHLLATCKYKTRNELLDRLRFEGAPKNEKAEDFLNNAESIIKEISQFDNTLDALFVKPKFHSEINLRWQWLLSSEREQLRRLIKSTQPPAEESTSIAPTRRSGIERQIDKSSKQQDASSTKPNDKPSTTINKPSKQQDNSISIKSSVTEPKIPEIAIEKQENKNQNTSKSQVKPSANGIHLSKRSPISTPSSIASNESMPNRKRHVPQSPDQPDLEQKRPRVHSFNGKMESEPSPSNSSGKYLEPVDIMETGRRRISNASAIGKPTKLNGKVETKPSPVKSLDPVDIMENGRRRISNASAIGKPTKLNGKMEVSRNSNVIKNLEPLENNKTSDIDKSNGKMEVKSTAIKNLEPMESNKRRESNASDIGKPAKLNGKVELSKTSNIVINGKIPEPIESNKTSDIKLNGKMELSKTSNVIKNLEPVESNKRRTSNASDIKLNGKVEVKPINDKIPESVEITESNKRRASTASDIGRPAKTAKTWNSTNQLEKKFPAIIDSKQAIRYHEMFESDYPKYRQYHDDLTKVSKKFNDLKMQFDLVEPGSVEQAELLRQIQDTYERYQNDKRYAETRRKHDQLHSLLSLLKRHVADWEKRLLTNGSSKPQSQLSGVNLSPMAQPSSARHTNRYRRERSASPGGSTTYSSNSAASTTSVESLGSASLFDEMALF